MQIDEEVTATKNVTRVLDKARKVEGRDKQRL